MLKPNCHQLVANYISWLKNRITTEEVNGACEITTPFLDRHNDRLQIYVVPTEKGLRITADGYIISDLEGSGCSLDSQQRKKMLDVILKGYGVQEADGELFVDATVESFPWKKHSLIQAMLTVN